MENVGVKPDMVVDNDPAKEFAGDDQQLKKNPPKLSDPPQYPKR